MDKIIQILEGEITCNIDQISEIQNDLDNNEIFDKLYWNNIIKEKRDLIKQCKKAIKILSEAERN